MNLHAISTYDISFYLSHVSIKATRGHDFFVYTSEPFIYISENQFYTERIITIQDFQVTGSYKGKEDDTALYCKYLL